MINGFKELTYEERLEQTNLVSLETRRLRADLIQVFKILKGLEEIKPEELFISRHDNYRDTSRGHQYKIFKQHCRLNIRKYFFSQRVIEEWNSLSEDTVAVETVNAFKKKIEPLMKKRRGQTIGQRGLSAPVARQR